MEAYVHGVSARKVDDLVRAWDRRGISKSEVSRICGELDEHVGAFRDKGAQICLSPITVHPGLERWRDWRAGIQPRHVGMVERAAQAHSSRRRDDRIVVHDPDPARAERRAELELRGAMAPVQHSAHPGRILSVR